MKKTAIALAAIGCTASMAMAQDASSTPTSEEALLQQQLNNLRQQLIQQNQMLHHLQNQLSRSQQSSSGNQVATGRASTERRAPAPSRSTEDLLLEQHNVFDRKFSLDVGLSYAFYDRKQLLLQGLVVYDAIFLGSVDTDRIRSHQWTADLTARYTFNDRWQTELKVPYLYRYMDFTATGDDEEGTLGQDQVNDNGLGDISAAVFYRVLTETDSRPDLVWNFRVTAPTGREPFGIPNTPNQVNSNLGDVPTKLATGTGLWGLSTGFSAVKTVDPAIIFANVDYTRYLKRNFSDISAAPGNQPGEVQLGDAFGYGLGMAFALSEPLSLSLSFNQSFNREAEQFVANGTNNGKIIGSDGNSATMGMGVTWAIDDKLSMVVNWAAGLTEDAPDYVVGVRFPYRF